MKFIGSAEERGGRRVTGPRPINPLRALIVGERYKETDL